MKRLFFLLLAIFVFSQIASATLIINGNVYSETYINASNVQNPYWLSATDQRYNDTNLILSVNSSLSQIIDNFTINETDPIWSVQSINYYNKSESDGRYLQSYTETDPIFSGQNSTIWSAINSRLNITDQRYNDTTLIGAVNLSLQAQITSINSSSNIKSFGFNTTSELTILFNTLYYSITNPLNFINITQGDARYLQSYTETDPIFSGQNSTIWSAINSRLNITDQRYNDTSYVNSQLTNYYTKVETNATIDSKITTTSYQPSSISTLYGTYQGGNASSISYVDGSVYNITESNSVNALEVYINFTGVTTNITEVQFYLRYYGGSNHQVVFEIYNYQTLLWEQHGYYIGSSTDFVGQSIAMFDSSQHISGGLVRIRFRHIQSGSSNDFLYIDMVNLLKGFSVTGQTSGVDPRYLYVDGTNKLIGNLSFYDGYGINSAGVLVVNGSATIGNASGYLHVASDGTLTLQGNATVWDDLQVPLYTTKVGVTNKPDFSYDDFGYLFPQNDPSEILYLIAQMPHDRKDGSMICPHLHWEQESALRPVWVLNYTWYNNGDNTTHVWTAISTNSTLYPYTSGNLEQISNWTCISGTGMNISSIFKAKLYRNDNVVTGDVLADSFDIHYEKDSLGSREEYVK